MEKALNEDLQRSVEQADDLLDASSADETTSDDPRLTGATAEADRRARFYERARETRDKLNSLLNDLGHKAGDAQRRVREQTEQSVREGLHQTEAAIKDKPFAAVGIAAGVGFLLGLLINRSR